MGEAANIGFLFYKDYYRKGNSLEYLDFYNKIETPEILKKTTNYIINRNLQDYSNHQYDDNKITSFSLKTTYPGFITGSGYTHEAGVEEVGFKIGFFFDYTTGLPVIPGSSVKGALRSVFPDDYLIKLKHDKDTGKEGRDYADYMLKQKRKYIEEKLKHEDVGIKNITSFKDIKKLEYEIFEGKKIKIDNNDKIDKIKTLSIYQRDIFFDAIIDIEKSKSEFLSDDYLCPHGDNPLKDPIPLMFLKIRPDVVFKFRFKLHDSESFPDLTAGKKEILFKKIIIEQGLGAKTNAGYGKFEQI